MVDEIVLRHSSDSTENSPRYEAVHYSEQQKRAIFATASMQEVESHYLLRLAFKSPDEAYRFFPLKVSLLERVVGIGHEFNESHERLVSLLMKNVNSVLTPETKLKFESESLKRHWDALYSEDQAIYGAD